MLSQLSIQSFRTFSKITFQKLGRINLIVGANQCGKTTVLQAIELLRSASPSTTLWQILERHGEQADDPNFSLLNAKLLFHGGKPGAGETFVISGYSESQDYEEFKVRIGTDQLRLFDTRPDNIGEIERRRSGDREYESTMLLTASGGLQMPFSRGSWNSQVRYLGAGGADIGTVVSDYQKIVLTYKEDIVLGALQQLDPRIERLAAVSNSMGTNSHEQFNAMFVQLKEAEERQSVRSLGNGIWQILCLTLALVSCKDGVLLVDEIDTGFHYSLLPTVWKIVDAISEQLNVQVFATTHSKDAYLSLATIAAKHDGDTISIQRIESAKTESIPFSCREIMVAADRIVEVR